MGRGNGYDWAPVGAPLINSAPREEEHWRSFDNSVNAVSFGFVATAILISMFLIMAVFERFFRPNSSNADNSHGDLESHLAFNGKLAYPSPKATVYANGVSVVMPGDDIPTFIAHPAPMPCSSKHISSPHHQQKQHESSSENQP